MSINWGQGAQGAAGGALAGSAFGPVGAGIGGVAGGLIGMFGSGDPGAQYRAELGAHGNRAAPQMGPAAQGGVSSFRGNQSNLVNTLEARSRGEGPSLATQQLQAGQDRGMRQAQSFAAGAGGPNAGLAQFQAQNMIGQNQAQTNQDAAQARIQEIYNAQSQLGLVLQGARGADDDMSRFNAGQQNQVGQANLEAKLRAMGLNDAAVMAALQSSGGQSNMGEQILAGGAGFAAQHSMMGQGQGLKPIAQGYPGAGGYWTPGQGNQQNSAPWQQNSYGGGNGMVGANNTGWSQL